MISIHTLGASRARVFSFLLVFNLVLTACGGGSGGRSATPSSPTTAQGVFVDNAVEGLRYASGDQSGVTDANGTFTYEVGNDVTFYVGEIELGSIDTSGEAHYGLASGERVVTPAELVADAVLAIRSYDLSNTRLLNILRFLQTLDNDNDLSNGIQITSTMSDLAILANGVIDFDQSLFDFTNDGAVQTQVSMMTAASTAGARSLIDETAAQNHFNTTLGTLTSPPVNTDDGTIAITGSDASILSGTTFTPDTFSSVPGTSELPATYIFANGPLSFPDQIITLRVDNVSNTVLSVSYGEPIFAPFPRWGAQRLEFNDIEFGQMNVTFNGTTFQFSNAVFEQFDAREEDAPNPSPTENIIFNGSLSIP